MISCMQVAQGLERINLQGRKRLKLSKTLCSEARKRSNYPEGPRSLVLLQQAAVSAFSDRISSAGAAGKGGTCCRGEGEDSEAPGRPAAIMGSMCGEVCGVALAAMDEQQPAASAQDGGVGSRADGESVAVSAEDGASREGSPAAAVEVHAAAVEEGIQGALVQGLVRPKKVVMSSVPWADDTPGAAAHAQDAEDAEEPTRIADFVTRQELLSRPIKVLFKGAAQLQAQQMLRHIQSSVSPAQEGFPEASVAREATGKRSRPLSVEASEPPGQRRRPAMGSVKGLPGIGAIQSSTTNAITHVLGVRGGRRGVRGSRGAGRRQGGSETVPVDVALKVQEDAAELQHRRNVMHLLGPGLLADAGLGPAAVRLPHNEAPALAASTNEVTQPLDSSLSACAHLPDPLDVLRRLSTSAMANALSLSVGVFELARELLQVLAAPTATGVPDLSKPLTTALVRLDHAWTGGLDPPAHLFYAELSMERAANFHRKWLVAAAAAGRRDARNSPPKRGRPSQAERAQQVAVEKAQDSSQHSKDAAAALAHACAHLAKFRTCCLNAGSTLQAAHQFLKRTADGDATAASVACNWTLRAFWLAQRAAVQHGDSKEAMGCLAACREMLQMEGSAIAEVPWCPTANQISLTSVTAVEQHINVQALLANLPAALESLGFRAVFREASAALLHSVDLPAAPAAGLFHSGRAHSQVLAKLFNVLTVDDVAQAMRNEAAVREESRSSFARAPVGTELAAAVGDLSQAETLWLRVTYALEYLRALLPLERTVAKAANLTLDCAGSAEVVLVR
jgi:hypothetical protein